jgi:hypothetical protein
MIRYKGRYNKINLMKEDVPDDGLSAGQNM